MSVMIVLTHGDKRSITTPRSPLTQEGCGLISLTLIQCVHGTHREGHAHTHTRTRAHARTHARAAVPDGRSLSLGGLQQDGDGGGRLVQEGLGAVVLL